MNRLTTQELEAIRKRAEQATEGPWDYSEEYFIGSRSEVVEVGEAYIDADAEFIANAREDIPKLLAEVEALTNALMGANESIREFAEIERNSNAENTRLRNALKPYDTTLVATNQRLQADLKEAESIVLWSARRLPKVYKPFAYGAIDELFGGKAERL